jgi:protein O-GlcNAc transferase
LWRQRKAAVALAASVCATSRTDRRTANLRREAEARGICGRRILFGDGLPRDRHLARLKVADLVLDTRICNGHTTTQDALWAGLPVITLQGRHFASRVSASLLHAVGLPELITHTLDDYENLAVAIGNDPERLADLKARLEPGRRRGALFNSARFVRHLEQAYTQMIDLWRAGHPPQHMEIVEQEAGGSKDEVGRQEA